MYLNRRAELEAWDIEQEFRRALHAQLELPTCRASVAGARRCARRAGRIRTSRRNRRPCRVASLERSRRSESRDERTIKTLHWNDATVTDLAAAWIGGSGCSAGSRSRRACSCGCGAGAARGIAGRLSSQRCCVGYDAGIRRTRSSRRRTCAISTSGRRACPTTSAPRPGACGIAASSARRWRCSIAACCRGSRTCTRPDSRFEHRRRLPGAGRAHLSRTASEYASRARAVWQRAVYGGDRRRRRRSRAVRRLRRARSTAPASNARGAGGTA